MAKGWRVGAGCLVTAALLLLVAFLADLPPFDAAAPGPAELVDDDATETPSDLGSSGPGGEGPLTTPEPPSAPPAPPAPPVQPPIVDPDPPPVKPQTPVPPPVDVQVRAVPFTGKQVSKAIDKGVAYLRKKQARNGSWGSVQVTTHYGADHGGYPAGPTALALYALLTAKQPAKDPVVKRGFAYLDGTLRKPRSSYETSMLLLAVTATADRGKMSRTAKRPRPPKIKGRYRSWVLKLVDQLVRKRSARGWRYNDPERPTLRGGAEDLSSTQLAALALFSARRLGIKVRDRIWEDVLRFTLAQQQTEGPAEAFTDPFSPLEQAQARARGFTYVKMVDVPDRGEPTGGMTACGVANLVMTRQVLTNDMRRGFNWQFNWQGRPNPATVRAAIVDGCAWLHAHWSPFLDPGKGDVQVNHVYYLWMLECAMDLLGVKELGSHLWYAEAGRELLGRQRPDGSWRTPGSWQPADVLDTAFAILFLRRSARHLIERE